MSNLKEIRGRVQSVKNTQQITKAMKMVSAAKLKKAQQNITYLKPYAKALLEIIADIASSENVDHPLLVKKDKSKKNILFVPVTSDRGLCGSFNASIAKALLFHYRKGRQEGGKAAVYCVGKKIETALKRFNIRPVRALSNLSKDISYEYAKKISKELLDFFLRGEYDEVQFIYNEFISVVSQKEIKESLIPVDTHQARTKEQESSRDVIFEPSPERVTHDLLERHFSVQVYRILSESIAAEHAARMTAMESASKNAKEMIAKLTLTYNKLRQASITKELIEICSGAEAINT